MLTFGGAPMVPRHMNERRLCGQGLPGHEWQDVGLKG
ncbi:hypothetical protein F4693_002637 [Sphingomonas endophytica]|uniref:Uncharacterized protein n=1 Tax=Sphingomonas endophytica TaxID=869719 RepID=A0A7X0JF82_9SPHN|nr:hypothetical protein [Sphingomonas endophytica]